MDMLSLWKLEDEIQSGTCFHCGKNDHWKRKYKVRFASMMNITFGGTVSIIDTAWILI